MEGIRQLPNPPTEGQIKGMTAGLKLRLEQLEDAKSNLDAAYVLLADDLSNEANGWDGLEIWRTSLRGTPVVKALRELKRLD